MKPTASTRSVDSRTNALNNASPLCVTCIGRNGSMIWGRYDDIEATGLDFIFEAWRIEDEGFPSPMHMLVVAQLGEARHIRHTRAGSQDGL